MKYRQCRLNKLLQEDTLAYTIAWLPEKFAHMGKRLKLKENGEWSDGWTIVDVYSEKEEEFVLSHERDYVNLFHSTDLKE